MDKAVVLKLIMAAQKARANSYSPYSGYKVGAALLAESGAVYTGCNVENASYPATVCAERTAFLKAVSEGERKFGAIAIIGGRCERPDDYAYPCGVCRQVMGEFCDGDFEIIVAIDESDYKIFTLDELLPARFEKL